jgi:hypothetical protein
MLVSVPAEFVRDYRVEKEYVPVKSVDPKLYKLKKVLRLNFRGELVRRFNTKAEVKKFIRDTYVIESTIRAARARAKKETA